MTNMTIEEIEKYLDDNPEKSDKYIAWINYQIGFSGIGTTALDIKPDFEMPQDLPEEVKEFLINGGKDWAKWKWHCWCESVKGIDDYAIEENWKCPVLG